MQNDMYVQHGIHVKCYIPPFLGIAVQVTPARIEEMEGEACFGSGIYANHTECRWKINP